MGNTVIDELRVSHKCFKCSTCTTSSYFFPKVRANYEDAAAGNGRKHEFIRSESDNWRTYRDEQNGEDDNGGWRLAGSRRDNERWCPPSPGMLHAIFISSWTLLNLKIVIQTNSSFADGPRSAGWREHPDQRRRFPFDSRGEDGSYRRPQSGSGSVEEERDSLPEWCLEDAEEETGTFDSSGAFLSLKVRALEVSSWSFILYYWVISEDVCPNECFWCVNFPNCSIRKLLRSRSWKRRSWTSGHWRRMKNAQKRMTVNQNKPKILTPKVDVRVTEMKVRR